MVLRVVKVATQVGQEEELTTVVRAAVRVGQEDILTMIVTANARHSPTRTGAEGARATAGGEINMST